MIMGPRWLRVVLVSFHEPGIRRTSSTVEEFRFLSINMSCGLIRVVTTIDLLDANGNALTNRANQHEMKVIGGAVNRSGS